MPEVPPELIVKLFVPVTPPEKVVEIAVPEFPMVSVPTLAFVARTILFENVSPVVPTRSDAAADPVVLPIVVVAVPSALALVFA